MFVHRPGRDDVVVHDSVLVRLGEDRPSVVQVEAGGSEASASGPIDSLFLPVGGPPQAASGPSVPSSSDRRVIADVRRLKFANASRWLVSRKVTDNLFKRVNHWKRALLDCDKPELKAPVDWDSYTVEDQIVKPFESMEIGWD
ncbi:hypothetical protein SERLA73DRAFT_157530 [Serpula lacrymans var. lacrymans S7.3]|uniref:Uncharacterized protein n=1 Tax=Serpula lacrymans var. lacrymans (strain S7.3) TaxID=936435 RepID=F8QJJ6_SERL3|nr:hypothetical protein SERLA73DRAFT_157530 [Serpula lacrymans var. lacrymans S7.3]